MAPPRRSCGLPLLLPLGLACGRPPRAAAAAVSPAQLQARLQHAADSGAQAFTVPPGSYRFGAAPLRLRGARGLSIRAGGATLWFEVGGGLEISESENITVSGLTIDYLPTYAQGAVVACCGADGRTLVADLDEAMQLPLRPGSESWFGGKTKVGFWDARSRTLLRDGSDPAAVNIYAQSFREAPGAGPGRHRYRISLAPGPQAAPPAGALVTVFPRGGRHSLALRGVSGSRFHGVSIYGGSSFGVLELMGGGGNCFHQLNVTRRPLPDGYDRLLATNADGFHSTSNTVGPTIQGSHIAFVGDDIGNINTMFFVVLRVSQGNNVTIIDHSGNFMGGPRGIQNVSFFHLNSFAPEGSAVRVKAARLATDDDAKRRLARARTDLARLDAHFQDAAWAAAVAVELSLERVPPGVEELRSTLAHSLGSNANARVLDSSFHDGYARAFLLKTTGTRVRNNLWARAGGIHVGPEQNWLEGDPGLTDVEITDNVLDACGTPAISVPPALSGRVVLRNNTEARPREVLV